MELDDILNDETVDHPEVNPVIPPDKPDVPDTPKVPDRPETEAEAQIRGRDATGKFTKAEPDVPVVVVPPVVPPVAPVQQLSDKEKGLLAAAQDERRKRQAIEREYAEFKAKATPADAPKEFWDDPEGAMNKFRTETRADITNARLNMAESIARGKYSDFDEKIAVFTQVLQATPGLHAQWLSSTDPAEYAYKLGKMHKELQDAGSIEALSERIRKETRIALEAEYKTKAEADAKVRAAIPGSLSDVRGTGAHHVAWAGPPDLDDILGNK